MAIKNHPYSSQPDKAFWRKTVEDKYPLDINNWYSKKFPISGLPIAAAGSCFAQHIGKQLKLKGFDFVDVEPPPSFLKAESYLDYGFNIYSARYGNIYSSRQLLQLLQRAVGEFTPREEFWEKDGGYVDPFRPTIEPEPFVSIEELKVNREHHLHCVRKMFEVSKVFVFTFGLTETWMSNEDGAAYPVAPGVSGGTYNDQKHRLSNLSYPEVRNDMESFIARVRKINPKMRFILTVSPVPLMATALDRNVIVSTMYSKSVLRAVAGFLADKYPFVDYFPSYEIIASHIMRGQFYNPDMRTVSQYGVDHVMKQFFAEHEPPKKKVPGARKNVASQTVDSEDMDDVVCDEELLKVFGA